VNSQSDYAEIKFMAEYTWYTLLALYDRLKLSSRLKLRNVKNDIVISDVAASAFKLLYTTSKLSDAVKRALRRIQATFTEELVISKETARNRIAVNLAAKFFPGAIPVYRIRLELETPANLLLAATLAEMRARLLELIYSLPKTQPELVPLRKLTEAKLKELLQECEYLLYEPLLRPLLAKAQLIASNEKQLAELERKVRNEVLIRPREYRGYWSLLKLRKLLCKELHHLEGSIKEIGETLTLSLPSEKLYELYGFTLLLDTLVREFNLQCMDECVDQEGRMLELKQDGSRLIISYNALPESLKSRFEEARARGIIDGDIESVKNLGGLPDTILINYTGDKKKTLLIDYKYTRNYNYLIQARFKAFSYLYEFNADYAVIVAPTPRISDKEDEETYKQRGFYSDAIQHQGAIIEVNKDGKVLALVYVDPYKEMIENSKRALRTVLKLIL